MAHIVFKDRESAPSQRVELRPGPNRLGRSRDNEIIAPHGRLSRAHARLDFEDGQVTLHDLGSSNGTEFRGQRITTVRLSDGDTFRCGGIEFTLEIDGPEQLSPTLVLPKD